ncbi:hypothetical protein D0Y65_001190, partial [Glycine soja]
DEQILEQNGIDMKSLSLKAGEERSKRPKNGDIYRELFSIDAAIEIADAAYLFRLLRKSNHDIEMAEMLSKKGKELLKQSKNKLKSTILS